MLEVNYQTMTDNISVDYDDIIAQVKIAPREYLPDIYKYIAFILYCSKQSKPQKEEKKKSPGLREFVGSIKIDRDPLEIQKELRNEWN